MPESHSISQVLDFKAWEMDNVQNGLKQIIDMASGNPDVARFSYPFFRDEALQREMAVNGFAVRDLLAEDDIFYLLREFESLISLLPDGLPETHWTSGRVNDPGFRGLARKAIDAVMPKKLEFYFDPENTDFVGGIFLAKKPSPQSELYPHQDSSHTDESKYPAVYAWVPLVDTTVETGAMHILPGSHLWGNRFRSLNIPWKYDGLQPAMFVYLHPCHMKAGQVLFFDSAAIHYSSNNMGSNNRPALNYFIKPSEALFLHHFIDHQTPAGMVEVFNVDIDFFYNCDFMQRPPCPPYRNLGSVPGI